MHFSDIRMQPCIGSRCAWWIHVGRDGEDRPEGYCGQLPPIPASSGYESPFAHITPFPDPAAKASR